jgi:post-segregation antitoxin (ccd killing protein)
VQDAHVNDKWPASVREPAYRVDAPRQTVSLTINSDLFTRVKSLGINASRVAEEALARELETRRRSEIEAEVRADIAAANAYEARHGSFSEMVREHYRDKEGSGN